MTISPTTVDGTSALPWASTSFDVVGQRLDRAGRNGPLLAGLADARYDLAAIELLAPVILLKDRDGAELDTLDRREPLAAGQALAPAADAVLVRRESVTLVSGLVQKGQFMVTG